MDALTWQETDDWFGGWSAVEISASGAEMTVISDRGRLLRGRLIRDGSKLVRVDVRDSKMLGYPDGRAVRKETLDAEGLAIGPDGSAHVSFEFYHRVMALDLDTGLLSSPRSFPFAMPRNKGMEALAVHPNGTLYAIGEHRPAENAPFALHALAGDVWQIAAQIPQRGPFVPVGADFDDRGRLWLLERTLTPLGFRSQIRLITFDPPSEVTLLTTQPAGFDNLEGLSAWRTTSGDLRLTLISDDNFLRIQRTQIVEYAVEE